MPEHSHTHTLPFYTVNCRQCLAILAYTNIFSNYSFIFQELEISKLHSQATWNFECNFHMPIFIARIEKARGRKGSNQMHNNTHRTHRGLWHTQHDTPHSCCTKKCATKFPKQPHRQSKYKNQRWERDRNDVSQFITIFCSSFNCLPSTTSIWVVGYIKALTNWKVSIVCFRYVIYIWPKNCNVATCCPSCFGYKLKRGWQNGGESYLNWQLASVFIVLCKSQMPRKMHVKAKQRARGE